MTRGENRRKQQQHAIVIKVEFVTKKRVIYKKTEILQIFDTFGHIRKIER